MDEKLRNIRHSLAHILAMAAREHDPAAKLGIGPAIDDGFYYDFEFSEGKTPSGDDLARLTKRMRALVKEGLSFEGREISEEEARRLFKDSPYKQDLISEFVRDGKTLTAYASGGFTDLCKGGHVASTADINPDAFELSRIAGAYWRGDEKNPMLTRIYGIAFETKEELDDYKHKREEAKKRDHRKIGKELNLFTFSNLVGSGLPLFTPKGTAMRNAIIEKIQNLQAKYGYEPVSIPHITKKDLYETSGHWEKFSEELFKVTGKDGSRFVMKPMNCPHHTQIYASAPRSYRELPIRFAETTTVYRDEQAGELLGLSRVRSITQDDAHVFCRLEDIEGEVRNIISVIRDFYTALGMFDENSFRVSLSVRDPEKPEEYLGDEENWKTAEKILGDVAAAEGFSYTREEGDAAFYGPKLDFMFTDALGRSWQLATIQLDFVMPERFGLSYADKDGTRKTPIMIHRAIAGSLERFLSVIIEHFAGAFPVWLSPVQIKLLPIGEAHLSYAREAYEKLRGAGVRAELDDSAESLGKKIRTGKMEKIPYLAIIGDAETAHRTLTLESRTEGNIGEKSIEDTAALITEHA